jgi:CO/xanthine dehydrogenase Mo-binding subunit
MAYDEHGQLRNASFMDFLMPYATEIPQVRTDHLETPSPLNPLGIKGAGEAGVIPGAAVLSAAISDAVGMQITRMPLAPDELFALLHGNGEAALPPIGALGQAGDGEGAVTGGDR